MCSLLRTTFANGANHDYFQRVSFSLSVQARGRWREQRGGLESHSSRDVSTDGRGPESSDSAGSYRDVQGHLPDLRTQRTGLSSSGPLCHQIWIMLELCSLGSLQVSEHSISALQYTWCGQSEHAPVPRQEYWTLWRCVWPLVCQH